MKSLTKNFFERDTIKIAKDLLGCYLINGKCAGKIVETEAYLHNDPASHSFRGKTARNQAMFGKAGTAYVYFTYGMHYCFNVVTNKEGIGEAVLIRALEPTEGLSLMQRRRKIKDARKLCSGPGKLVQAMGITKKDNGKMLNNRLRIEPKREKIEAECSCRRGITKAADLQLRFYVKNNLYVSK